MQFTLPIQDPTLQFTMLVMAAFLMQLTLERLHLPGLIGLLVIGMLLGPGGFQVFPEGPVIQLLGQVGLIYIMFLAGLELDLDIFKTHRRETIVFGLLAFFFCITPGVAVGILLGFSWPAALLLGTLLSSHTLISYPLIEKLGLLHRKAVVTAVGGTLITDTLALLILAVVIQIAGGENNGNGNGNNLPGMIGPLFFLALLVAGSFWSIPRLARYFFENPNLKPVQKALFVLLILLVLASLAELIGTKDILGAFLAGLCLNQPLRRRESLREHLEFVGRMLFIPFFFIETGMRLELEVFTGRSQVWLMAGLLVLLVLAGKSAAAWIAGARYGYARKSRFLMIGLTVPQAAATLAVSVTARETGLFEKNVIDAVIILIFATCIIGPTLTGWVGQRISRESREEN
jgi:Kef-type K+ transport system membrane component KefB